MNLEDAKSKILKPKNKKVAEPNLESAEVGIDPIDDEGLDWIDLSFGDEAEKYK